MCKQAVKQFLKQMSKPNHRLRQKNQKLNGVRKRMVDSTNSSTSSTGCTIMVQPDINQLLTAVILLDDQLSIVYMNAAAEAILDGSLRRFYQQPFLEFLDRKSVV